MATVSGIQVPENVKTAYLEPHRHYHTLEHIYNGLSVIPKLCDELDIGDFGRRLINCAWWHHDVIYWPGAPDNEKRSADWAVGNVPAQWQPIIREMIMATVYPDNTRLVHPYIAVIQDADLYGLAAPEAIFDHHTAQVREEFKRLDDESWAAGRLTFWETLLAKQSPIYKSEYAQAMWGHEAMHNITREMAALRG